MGQFFRMSTRFNKKTPHDFGLSQVEGSILAVDPKDGTLWEPCSLFDFGWGNENGYFKQPMLQYEELLLVVLSSEDRDDIYGAAAVILDQYPVELLYSCERFFSTSQYEKEARVLDKVFDLQRGFNMCPTMGKTLEEIHKDASRWQAIASIAKNNAAKKKKEFKPFWKLW